MKCIVCNAKSNIVVKDVRSISKCTKCKLEFANPMPSSDELDLFYKTYKNPRAKKDVTKANALKNIDYLKGYGLNNSSLLLDFGCGDNMFVKSSKSKLWTGYDPYSTPSFPNIKFDFITLWGVLEHLANPIKELKFLNNQLKDSGIIAMTTVCTETKIPYQHKVPEHVSYWSYASIKALAEKTGFKVVEISPYFMYQAPKVYLECVLNAGKVPDNIKKQIRISSKKHVFVPTNEVLIILKKRGIKNETNRC